MISRPNQLDPDLAMILVIDMQVKLLPLVRKHDRVISAAGKLLDGARIFELPVIATEQYPKGIGATHETIARSLQASRATVLEKPTFSAWAHGEVREAIREIDRPQIILAGIETHVCVQQSALDLVSRSYDVFVCADATGARGLIDHDVALARMRQDGAWVTTVESVLFELCGRCDSPRFKAMLDVIKRAPPSE